MQNERRDLRIVACIVHTSADRSRTFVAAFVADTLDDTLRPVGSRNARRAKTKFCYVMLPARA